MVDFNKKLLELKAWRARRAECACECVAQSALVCYEIQQGDGELVQKCSCKCHKKPEPTK